MQAGSAVVPNQVNSLIPEVDNQMAFEPMIPHKSRQSAGVCRYSRAKLNRDFPLAKDF
jgi:aspartate ammonia-lyase